MLRLERMEILGFKSFYSRTKFDFPAGITAVVGPNGCGKSNIGDAISWVLGDQSARSLRGDKMEDVIFNGSEKRKPLGMAEVSLTLGPRAGAPEADPLVITRRLYRSGDSEYLINGDRSRLKDIRELLENRRIASKMSSVIEQGRVDEVITAKPRDRRLLFEEAAGIAGNKAKKRLAMQKLESAEDNLGRVGDILSEVDGRIRSVRRQAARARRYTRLMDRIRQLRAVVFREKNRALGEQRRTALAEEERRREQEAGWTARVSQLELDWERNDQELREADRRVAEHRDRVHRCELERQRQRGDRDRFREQREEVGVLAVRESERRRLTEAELEALRRQLGEAAGRGRDAEGRVEAATTAAAVAAAEFDREMESLCDAERRREEARQRVVALLTEAGECRSRALQAQEQLRGLDQRRTKLGEEIEAVRGEAAEADRQVEGLAERLAEAEQARDRHTADHGRAETEWQEGRGRLESLEAERVEADQRAAVQENRRDLLLKIRSERQSMTDRVRDLLSGNGASGNGSTAQLLVDGVPVREGMERALDAALGRLGQAFLVADGGRAAAAARTVREAGAGGGRFVWNPGAGGNGGRGDGGGPGKMAPSPPATPPTDERILLALSDAVLDRGPRGEALSRIVRHTLVVRDLDAALALHREHPAWHYVTPIGELVHADGILEDGAEHSGGAFSLDVEIETLEAARGRIETRCDELRREIDTLRASVRAGEENVRVLARQGAEFDRRAVSLGVECDARRAEWEKTGRRIESLQKLLDSVQIDRDRLGRESAELDTHLEAAEAERVQMEARAAAIGAELDPLRRAVETTRSRHQEADRHRHALEVESRAALREVQKMRRGEEDLLQRRDASERELAELSVRREAAELAAEKARVSLGRLEEEIATASSEQRRREEDLEAIRADMLSRKEPIREARREREAAREQLREAELLRTRLDAEVEHLEQSCREELGCAPAEVTLPEGDDLPSYPESEREVGELKAKIQRLGPVNLVAVEELDELEKRFHFLSTQRQDLLDAIASLKNTILRINRESRERFVTAFEAIRERFQANFEILFGGGRAELRLEESDDPLQAGVEIVAQPPGKRLQSIRLLSGGEKALTAIALLFGVFQFRPSAFCVLDEVDAPLDEANVERFSRMLRRLTKETQFILITHSRRSMENADNLYGVTMEESGISKVMSLQIERGH